jgi:RecG-like helicase
VYFLLLLKSWHELENIMKVFETTNQHQESIERKQRDVSNSETIQQERSLPFSLTYLEKEKLEEIKQDIVLEFF